jgi:hypothetical protein
MNCKHYCMRLDLLSEYEILHYVQDDYHWYSRIERIPDGSSEDQYAA